MRQDLFVWLPLTVIAAIAGFACGNIWTEKSNYDAGFTAGVRDSWSEFDHGRNYYGQHVVVPLYEGGKPCSVLFVQPNVKPGATRHLMVRKVGCGAHWDLPSDAELETEALGFGDGADYSRELLERNKSRD